MIREPLVPLFDLVLCLSDAVDLVSPTVAHHHKQVAYLSQAIAREMGFNRKDRHDVILAGMLHDVGALSLQERISLLAFETAYPHQHAEIAYRMLQSFPHLAMAGQLTRFHHVPWNDGRGTEFRGLPVPLASHILHLADRVAVSIARDRDVLSQVPDLCERVATRKGTVFAPEVVEAFLSVAVREFIWLDATSPALTPALRDAFGTDSIELAPDDLLAATELFRQIVDFRSRFTARHSAGVAATAETLARACGFSARERRLMRIAGHLHDLGKLAVPAEILEKPDRLTDAEFNIIRTHTFHTYFTYRTLQPVAGMDTITAWAAFHHERLDGSGYPFHLDAADLPLGSRIMAVADVFTALAEDRPYRKGMEMAAVLRVLREMADKHAIDAEIVSQLQRSLEDVNAARVEAQTAAVREYGHLIADITPDLAA